MRSQTDTCLAPPNTYEPPSCQEIIFSRPTAAPAAVPVSSLSSVGLGFVLCLRFAVRRRVAWTLHPTPIEAHAWSPIGDPGGEASPPRPRSSSVPSYRPPHDVDLEGPLSPGSGKGQSRERPSALRPGMSEREREPVSNQSSGLPGHRAHDRRPPRARRRPGTMRSSRAQALAAPVGRRAHGSRSLSSRSRQSVPDRTPSRA